MQPTPWNAIIEAERFGRQTGVISIGLFVLAMMIWFLLRSDRRGTLLAIVALVTHPLLTIPAWPYGLGNLLQECGRMLRIASLVWIAFGSIAVFLAVRSVWRDGVTMPDRVMRRFSVRTVLATFCVLAIVASLARPPLSVELNTRQWLPWFIGGVLTVLALRPAAPPLRHRALPTRVSLSDPCETPQT